MAEEKDLQGVIAAIGQALTRLEADQNAILERLKTAGIPDADIQALAAISTEMGSAADKIEAILTPPATPS